MNILKMYGYKDTKGMFLNVVGGMMKGFSKSVEELRIDIIADDNYHLRVDSLADVFPNDVIEILHKI